MSEEVEGTESGEVESKGTPSIEETAKGMGWNPDYDGDNKVSAEEYVARKPLYDTTKKLKRRIRDLEHTVTTQKQVSEKLLAAQKKELLGSLEAKKKQAIKDADADEVVRVDKEIDEAKQEFARTEQSTQQAVDPVYQNFLDNNSWYEDDTDMRAWADGVAVTLSKQGKTPAQVIEEVSNKVKKVFAHKFEKPAAKSNGVEAASRAGQERASEDPGWADIPKEYRTVAIEQWKAGAFKDDKGNLLSKKEAMKLYAKDLKTIGVIE